VTGELHAVTGVTGEPDDHPIELLNLLGHSSVLLDAPERIASGAFSFSMLDPREVARLHTAQSG
ncbi:hypothetical protein, partial [Nonomuraea ferruginea]|uniref:hypothetical protein n=1 Tax=Nonomuraea ferruginea TaxID=46174 RepID=UPI0036091FDD